MSTVLILEDNSAVLSRIFQALEVLMHNLDINVEVVQFSTSAEAKEYLGTHPEQVFDLILLDKNDANGESFHDLPLEKLGVEKIISISSVPRSNDEARARGVTRVVLKDYDNPEVFAETIEAEIRDMLGVI